MRKERPLQNAGRAENSPHNRADRLEAKLNEVLAAVHRQSSPSSSYNNEAGNLIDAFHRIVLALERLLSRHAAVDDVSERGVDVSRLARALLITGNGARLEPCVLLAIREYRIADENVTRYQSADLPEPLKADLLARFRQQLDSAQQCLELLEVQIFEPAVAEAVDSKRHRVLRKITSEFESSSDTIAEVISPGFEWINDEGSVRVVPAHVAVQMFEPLKTRSPPKERSAEWRAAVPLTLLRDVDQLNAEPFLRSNDSSKGDL